MRVLPLFLLLALSLAAHAQEPSPGQMQPDPSGQRLQQLLRTADELQRAGRQQEAAAVRQQAAWERQALRNHMESLQAEVGRLRQLIGQRPQVLVHIRVFEVSLTKLKKIKFDMSKLAGNSPAAPNDASKNPQAGTYAVFNNSREAEQVFESLRKDNLAKVIAEPSLVTTSGQTASFNSGGQVPLPTKQQDGSKAVNWQQYGTQVQLTPEILGDRTIRLDVHCQISELDYSHAVTVDKDTVPGIQSRDFSNRTELQSGQTVVFSGLNQSRVELENHGLPLVSEIPYAGAAFRTVKETRNDIGLFVMLSAEIVEPSATPPNSRAAVPMQASHPTGVRVRR